MIILGLNAFHGDSAVAVVRDGALVAAAEEERFRRIKHWAGFPSQSIAYCLREAGLCLSDVEHVAVNADSGAHRLRKVRYFLSHSPNVRLVLARLQHLLGQDSVTSLRIERDPDPRQRQRRS